MNKMFIKYVKKLGFLGFGLIILFLIAFFLRIYLLESNLFFGPEQGRDLSVVKEIVTNHKLVLIGPRTAIEGIFHGPLYYYLATIPFLLSKGNPYFIELFLVFINSLTVFVIYLLGKELFNKNVGIISAFLFTFSFEAIVFARWLSHPPLAIPLTALLFLCLAKFIKGEKIYLFFAAIFFSLLGQSGFFNFIYFTPAIILFIFLFRKKIFSQRLIYLFFCVGSTLVFSLGTYLFFDLRHQFLISKSFIGLFTKHSGFYTSFSSSFLASINTSVSMFTDSLSPSFIGFSIILILGSILVAIIQYKKYKMGITLIVIWLISPIIMFSVLKYDPLYHYFSSSLIAMIILASVFVGWLWDKKNILGFVLLVVIIIINFLAWKENIPLNKNIYFQSTQLDLKYSDQLKTIDRIYKEANGKPFYFQSYTIPYWLQEEWQYLFWYWGKGNYGYEPLDSRVKTLFVIIQDDPSNKLFQNNWLKDTVSTWGVEKDNFKYGVLTIKKLEVK